MNIETAIENIANELNNFDFAIGRMKEAVPSLHSTTNQDKILGEALGVSQSTFATWKARKTMQKAALIDFCIKHDVDLNWFFKGSKSTPSSVSESKVEDNDNAEELIKAAMLKILPVMERSQLSVNEKSLTTMIKTYIKYNKAGADVDLVLRAVAEAQSNV